MITLRRTAAGFPMAPTQEEWDALSPEERAEVDAALPGEVTDAEMSPPEGDRHFQFYSGTAMLLESEELIGRLERMLEDLEQRHAEEARLREEAVRASEREARLREEADREVARLREEVERLKRKG